jgi:hypothetical protein
MYRPNSVICTASPPPAGMRKIWRVPTACGSEADPAAIGGIAGAMVVPGIVCQSLGIALPKPDWPCCRAPTRSSDRPATTLDSRQ